MRFALCVLLVASVARATETQTLPTGTFSLDVSYLSSSLDKQWSGDRKAISLIDDSPRYEPGAGLQGILRARPRAELSIALLQILYGVTDWLTVGLYVPIVLQAKVTTNLSWQPGDYQSSVGRVYSFDDFWAWAASLGQPRVPDQWTGNQGKLSDLVLGGRVLLPRVGFMEKSHFRWAGTLSVALPTGTNFDPEAAVSVGTNLWELNATGDVETHLAADQPLFLDDDGVARVNLGADVFGSFFYPQRYVAGTGKVNPLLDNIAPYVGSTYTVNPGSWLGASFNLEVSPIIGPSRASIVSGGDAAKARALPALLTLSAGITHVRTAQTYWHSESPTWDWDHEKYWQPGDKTTVRVGVTVSFLRLGVPLQLYANYRTQSLVPGRYTRAADVFAVGARTVLKFW